MVAEISFEWLSDNSIFSLELLSLLHIAAFLAVCIHCLKNRRPAQSALLWMFLAWSFPIIGPIVYMYIGVNRVPAKGAANNLANQVLLQERRAREDKNGVLSYWQTIYQSLSTRPESDPGRELNTTMDHLFPDHPLLGGNKIRTLVTGDEAYPRMEKAIKNAHHHIHMQTFMIWRDSVGKRILDLLAQKAREGVKVRLLYDRFGSTGAHLSGMFLGYKRIPNFEIIGWTQVNPLKRQFQINLRNHRKIMVVDGEVAFCGGLNFCDDNITTDKRSATTDYHFELRGPIVQELQYTFLRDWHFMSDEDPATLLNKGHFPKSAPCGQSKIRVANGSPTAGTGTMSQLLFTVISAARKQILIATPYFVPNQEIQQVLRNAVFKGVDVRLIVPGRCNHIYAGYAGQALYEDLLEAGVRIFEHNNNFIHAKICLIDNEIASVGSANTDIRSFNLNYETNLVIHDTIFVNQMKELILNDEAQSNELNLREWQMRPLKHRLMENFCSLMTPIL